MCPSRYIIFRKGSESCSYLSGTVAAKSLEMLPVSQMIRKTAILKWDPGIDEGGSTAVVVNKEGL